jgi:hypothetical protein
MDTPHFIEGTLQKTAWYSWATILAMAVKKKFRGRFSYDVERRIDTVGEKDSCRVAHALYLRSSEIKNESPREELQVHSRGAEAKRADGQDSSFPTSSPRLPPPRARHPQLH